MPTNREKIKAGLQAVLDVIAARMPEARDSKDFETIARQLRQAAYLANQISQTNKLRETTQHVAQKAKARRCEFDVRLIDKHGDAFDVHAWESKTAARRDFDSTELAGDIVGNKHVEGEAVAVVLEVHDLYADTYTVKMSRGCAKALEEWGGKGAIERNVNITL